MNDNISFDKASLENLVGALSTFQTNVNEANDLIQEQIGVINANWSGPLHDTAKTDLTNIANSMPVVVENTSSAYGILAGVQEGFNNIKY